MFKLFIIIITFLSFERVHLQNASLFRFSAINQVEIPEMAGIVTVPQQPTNLGNNERQEEAQREITRNIQCLYDFQGNRVNKECVIADRPLKCERGTLVQTIVGSEYEMCCCNFAIIA